VVSYEEITLDSSFYQMNQATFYFHKKYSILPASITSNRKEPQWLTISISEFEQSLQMLYLSTCYWNDLWFPSTSKKVLHLYSDPTDTNYSCNSLPLL